MRNLALICLLAACGGNNGMNGMDLGAGECKEHSETFSLATDGGADDTDCYGACSAFDPSWNTHGFGCQPDGTALAEHCSFDATDGGATALTCAWSSLN